MVLLYFCEDIPSRFLKSGSTLPLQSTQKFDDLLNILGKYSNSYENLKIVGGFNVTMDDKFLINFCEQNDLSSLMDKPTCYKNFDKPTCIEVTLKTNPVASNIVML